jgi:predicted enzyme related to lactoylglutathione lyase
LQRVPEGKQGKNRMHLDIETADVDGEVERLLALGATRAPTDSEHEEHGMRWVVLADPEGNEFCVCTGAVC